jgi:ATP-binding cassette, subfamily A (ABC1), member 3
MIGVCPQHDRLYEDLTVEEHLFLFGELKGLKGEEL